MKFRISQALLVLLVFLLPLFANAAAPAWQIVPNESSITFTGIQNDAPASGKFKKFSGTIHFDPDRLNESKVRIVIDMNSVSTSYSDFTSTLVTEDWFNVKLFPEAIFEATTLKKTGDSQYQAAGTLTIRDKTVPVTLSFESKKLSETKALVKGNTTLKRTMFGIGQGEWADTDAIKDDVQVNFNMTAARK
ncbi:MAG: hypothetical protein A3E84_00880 [Gammaproteobacteria bacterium RIFCSPHIGHO2_12_FULL_42_13]|nr:MAG: hypothetical protein A3E84_00880 [Gammaproteobacteria bacterium RIFCSPHIGHO2_12_FULL_42_13]